MICDGSKKSDALSALIDCYDQIVSYINLNPVFGSAYYPVDVCDDCPAPVLSMARAAKLAGVGPMAAVAGTISRHVGEALLNNGCEHVVVDNGGDIFIKAKRNVRIGLYSGCENPLSRLAFHIKPEYTPVCICTSSSTVGHSISLGCANSVTVFASDGALADAFATSIANNVKSPKDLEHTDKIMPKGGMIEGVFISAFGGFSAMGLLPDIEKS